ncbi:hypothetical protein COU75_00490 [Candidatus Peregrinibacteria bacterium CG10_big_fil_rev_8_21_14_0_10_42_8]|nr:MAG: hypothetical protein COU75_00490 [Candidatus Peregrinibacteria bacterium CG10_big_fil_rev_8_21_14_0_10_42_8]
MISLLVTIGILLTPIAHAAEPEEETLYYKIKNLVELEILKKHTELSIERFASGIFYDKSLETNIEENGVTTTKQMEIETSYIDMSLVQDTAKMCGNGGANKNEQNEHITCLAAQEVLKGIVDRNSWHRILGRDLQAIASGYEVGIEGYPGKPVDAIMRMSSIAQLWRAANDPFTQPFLETLTRAEPWPEGQADTIEQELKEVVSDLKALILKDPNADHDEAKEDDTAMVAAMWRYKNGVNYLHGHEGVCGSGGTTSNDIDRTWLDRRWCAIEDKLLHVLNDTILANANLEMGNDEFVIFPSFIDKENNIFIWIRNDDIGLQWYIPIEPVQAALYHATFGDCLEGDSTKHCSNIYGDSMLIRGGNYPIKQDGSDLRPGGDGLFTGPLNPPRESEEDADGNPLPKEGLIVPQPKEGEGICSHPFSKRGYLCRAIESEACDLTTKDEEELQESGTGGIVLTRCQPERFKDDVARKTSGSDICQIGGWRENIQENRDDDSPYEDPDMTRNECAACAIDIVCKEKCWDDPMKEFDAKTSSSKREGVIEVCVPTTLAPNDFEYMMAHELVHAQQICNESNIQSAERLGYTLPKPEQAAACCAAEREPYFVQCKMLALDGVLDKAGITIDQCASAFANHSCKHLDEDPEDDDYVCTNDGVDPRIITPLINEAIDQMEDQLSGAGSCPGAMNDPRILAIRNSMPLSCKPGCQSKYVNTIGNNLCYTGQCLEETHEWSAPIAGRSALTSFDEAYPWVSCEVEDPNIGQFAVPPALTSPRFPLYRPEYLLKQLDDALCQINGLPARTPPALCGFEEGKTLNLPPLQFLQSGDNLSMQPGKYNTAATALQNAAQGLGARISNEMFIQYVNTGAKNFAELMNMSHRLFKEVGDIEFPSTMCPRYIEGDLCEQLQQ